MKSKTNCTSNEHIDFTGVLVNELEKQNVIIKEFTLEIIQDIIKELDVKF